MPSGLLTTDAGVQAATEQSTGEVFCYLMEIEYDPDEDHLFFTNNDADLVSNGVTYFARGFEFILPTESSEREATARITIEDVDRTLIARLRTVLEPPMLTFTVIRANDPDVIEGTVGGILIRNLQVGGDGTIVGDLSFDSFVSEPYPIHRYDPALFPGLFP